LLKMFLTEDEILMG